MRTRQQIIEAASPLVGRFLTIRVKAIQRSITGVLNINPFLVRALEAVRPMRSQMDLAVFMWDWHIALGYATAFAKAIDEKILPAAFLTEACDKYYRAEREMLEPCFDDIDHVVGRRDGTFLLSLKASAWSIQHGQAMGMYGNFRRLGEIGRQESGIVVGVYYGHAALLTNKYDIVRGINRRYADQLEPLDYVQVHSGKEFWSWLNDDEQLTQEWMLEAIAVGADEYKRRNPEVAEWLTDGGRRLRDALRTAYGLPENDSLDFFLLLHAINDGPPVARGAAESELIPGAELDDDGSEIG